ncbi:MAG: metallophosphoesterase, partial [Clostridia bacterium]|nr:metallophosphoesterase [Clostridia bacterium]
MKVYAIGDLHLSLNSNKPMDVFGDQWKGHFERVSEAWNAFVLPDDIVLLPGDLSWAMRLPEAMEDICAVGKLPGRKVILRGNHDYWWTSITQLRASLPENMYALQNDALQLDGVAIAGTRGWLCPGCGAFASEDQKIYEREAIRLELSLQNMKDAPVRIGMLHYPPCNERREASLFTELFTRYNVQKVVYGHLHGAACRSAFEGERGGVQYALCSADYLDFAPRLLLET